VSSEMSRDPMMTVLGDDIIKFHFKSLRNICALICQVDKRRATSRVYLFIYDLSYSSDHVNKIEG